MSPTPPATELDTAQRLRVAIGRITRLARRSDLGSGVELTPTRVAVLLGADRLGPLRLAELGERESLNPTLLSRTIGTLVTDGLLERKVDPDDRRAAWVTATPAGHAAAVRVRSERTAALRAALEALPDVDRRLIARAIPVLERLGQALAEAPR